MQEGSLGYFGRQEGRNMNKEFALINMEIDAQLKKIELLVQAKIEEARADERKRIGEYLQKQNWNPDYHGAYIIPRPIIKTLLVKLLAGKSPAEEEQK